MMTPLFKVIKRGDITEVRRLLASGVDPNESKAEFWTPLAYAAARGHTPIVMFLLQAGAQPTSFAVQTAAFRNHARTVRVLLAAGAPVDPPADMPLLNSLKWSGLTTEQQRRVRQLLRDAGGRELPDWYLRWQWNVRYGWRMRLRRWLWAHGWQHSRRRVSN
jgi:ankyrin repeat protein